jgi:hypothetical protein
VYEQLEHGRASGSAFSEEMMPRIIAFLQEVDPEAQQANQNCHVS